MMIKQTKRENSRLISNSSPPLQNLVGKIVDREEKKVYKKNEFYGNTYFKLKIISENEEKKENIFVYSNLVSEQIFQDIEQRNYIKKRIIFFCEKIRGGWILHNWQELTPNLGSFDQESILKDHEKTLPNL